jgi:tripartite ATP-independent transporter DctP family solute receptor
MKKLIAMLLVLVMVFALGAAAYADEPSGTKVGKTELSCAFNQSSTNPECETLRRLSDALYDATEGRYSLKIYPDASLGSQQETIEQLMIGALDMSLVGNSVIEPFSSDFAVIATPYIYDDIAHQERVFESGGLADLFATTEEHGFTVLCAYSLGARNLYTRDGPVTTPEELKGLKIRIIDAPTNYTMMENMGGVGVGMPQGDVYSAIQTKQLDGAENNIITYVDLVQYEVAPYYNYTGHLLLPDELIINNDVLASMSEEDQAALRKVCAESMPVCYELCNELRSEYQAKAEAQGVTFSEADIPAFQANCQDQIKEVAERTDITKGVYELIMSLRETA